MATKVPRLKIFFIATLLLVASPSYADCEALVATTLMKIRVVGIAKHGLEIRGKPSSLLRVLTRDLNLGSLPGLVKDYTISK